jgi:integration host factor subunit beta
MLKSELVQRIAGYNPHLYARDVEKIINSVFESIAIALKEGNRVELRGFGVFSVKSRPARTGRNPRNGSSVQVAGKSIPYFKPSKEMHRRLNPETVPKLSTSEKRGSH